MARTKKTAKPKSTKLDFTAPKGKVRVHIFIAVDDDGNVSDRVISKKDDRFGPATVEQQADNAMEDLRGTNAAIDVHHIDITLTTPAKPKALKPKKVAAKPKKVAESRPEPEPASEAAQ